jgi:hypothetical protein
MKVGIYDSTHHSYHTPEGNTDIDVMRDQSRKRSQGKYGSPTPETTTIHHHRSSVSCIGYYHEQFHLNGETRHPADEDPLKLMRESVPTQGKQAS